jgi:hypothetical protein
MIIKVGKNKKLLRVPDNQKIWYMKNYAFIYDLVKETELIDYGMLQNNIFGVEDRFLEWHSDLNGIVDDILENYILQYDKTVLIIKSLFACSEEAVKNEYFELTNNINLLLDVSLYCIEGFIKQNNIKPDEWYENNRN